jgi:hypothetical protein
MSRTEMNSTTRPRLDTRQDPGPIPNTPIIAVIVEATVTAPDVAAPDVDSACVGAIGVIEICLEDLEDDTRERDSESYDGDSPTTLECTIQRQLDAIRASVCATAYTRWPSAFLTLCSLAVTGAELLACTNAAAICYVQQVPEMWRLLEYPKIVLAVHRSRKLLNVISALPEEAQIKQSGDVPSVLPDGEPVDRDNAEWLRYSVRELKLP